MQASAPLLGGAGVFVAIDETFFTKKKYVRGGFVGRYTMGMLTCVLGMIEICLATRRATGRVRLLIIQNRDKSTIYAAIRQHVQRGSLIFTDGFKSYLWLSRRFSGFVHRWVNHRRGQFSRWEKLFGVWVLISTNAAEGLFGRFKVFARKRGLRRVSHDSYELLMSEFIWRNAIMSPHSEWHKCGLWSLCEMLVSFQNVNLGNGVEALGISQTIADALQQLKEHSKFTPFERLAELPAGMKATADREPPALPRSQRASAV